MLRTFESSIWICRTLLVSLAFSIGCVSALPRLPETTMPSSHEAYVGGLFRNDAKYQLGFRLMNESTWQTYVLGFGDSTVSVVAIPPGHYRVIHYLVMRSNHSLFKTEIVGKDLSQHFTVVGGQVVLLGKFFVDHTPISSIFGGNEVTVGTVGVTEAQASGEFQRTYFHFLDQRVRCLACAQ